MFTLLSTKIAAQYNMPQVVGGTALADSSLGETYGPATKTAYTAVDYHPATLINIGVGYTNNRFVLVDSERRVQSLTNYGINNDPSITTDG